MVKNIDKLTQIFSSLSDETRLKIVISLMDNPKNVNEIFEAIGQNITLSAVSHQLKQLTQVGLLVPKKEGRERRYTLSQDFCWCIVKKGLNHYSAGHKCKCSKTE